MTIQQLLLKYWGFNTFRPLQEDIIQAVLEKKDTLALLPTGGGKSICFQVPAMAMEGICIVVSPLISLMKDQVENLTKKGIKAMAITSVMSKKEIDIAFDNCNYGNYKFLYISPERLTSQLARERIKKMNISFIAVDEAHCISQWGYDFRPSYLLITELREILPGISILALTATATPEVVLDIQKKLLFKTPHVLSKSFERKNLAYVVSKTEDKYSQLLKIANKIKGSGIVYVHSRKKTQSLVDFFNKNKLSADLYHAGLNPVLRSNKQDNWIQNKTRIMVATNAFGMGIDKADVRFVVHFDLPDSLEAYFQEAGRAGRDEKKAFAVLLFQEADRIDLEHHILSGFPSLDEIKQTYQALSNYLQLAIGSGLGLGFDFEINDFCNQYNLNTLTVFNSLKFLEKEGYISTTESFNHPSRILFIVNKEELYKFQIVNPALDGFIKLVLRSYVGVFEDFVKINEAELAKRMGISREETIKLLKQLHLSQVLSYVPQSSLPKIIFTRERIDAKNLIISTENLKERKNKAIERMENVIHYASSEHKCRSQILLSYFGEQDTYRCGICDVCLERNKLELSKLEFENVSNQLKDILQVQVLNLTELVNSVKGSREDKTLKVIQWLIENEKLAYDEDYKLHWKK